MHKKSLEMSKKCSSPLASDSTRSDMFCDTAERQASEAQEELLEEEDVEEEVAIDLSSSSKQQQEEGGASTRTTPSPQLESSKEPDKHS